MLNRPMHTSAMRAGGMKRLLLTASIVAVSATLAGCEHYLSREDRIVYWAGDAKAHNTAVHVIDPWPRHAFNSNIRTPGARAASAMKNYRSGKQTTSQAADFSPKLTNGN